MEQTTKFAYVDRGEILHVVKDMDTALTYAKKGTTVVPTKIEARQGYPVVNGVEVIVYDTETMKYDANGRKITPVPELAVLYTQCIASN